jgi:hypothetical protein
MIKSALDVTQTTALRRQSLSDTEMVSASQARSETTAQFRWIVALAMDLPAIVT